ncbi:hypothetical protein FGIG_03265, partial [Fasciola gigantica]
HLNHITWCDFSINDVGTRNTIAPSSWHCSPTQSKPAQNGKACNRPYGMCLKRFPRESA